MTGDGEGSGISFQGIQVIKYLCSMCLIFELFLSLMLVFNYELFTEIYLSIQPLLMPIIVFNFVQVSISFLHLSALFFFIRQLRFKNHHLPLRSDMMPKDTALKLDDIVYQKMVEGILHKVQTRESLMQSPQRRLFR